MIQNLSYVFELFETVQEEHINYIYRGHFDNYITENILSLAETNLVDAGEKAIVKKKVYHIMVECLQNITKHQAVGEQDSKEQSGIFFIQNKKNRYFLTTGNLIHMESIGSLRGKIEKVNSLDKDELKEYYKEMLVTGELSDKGGAGLGLIDMARKSGNKLLSDFKQMNEEFSFFYLHTEIPSSKKDKQEVDQLLDSPDNLDHITGLHHIINEKNIDVIFNSIFTQDSLMNLLSIIEGKLADSVSAKKKIFSLMVEIFQNIVHHGEPDYEEHTGKPGMFFLGETDETYNLNAINYVLNTKTEQLSNRIERLNVLNMNELDDLYSKTMMDFNTVADHRAGLGFIDMILKSKNTLNYMIKQVNDLYSFFVIQVVISKNDIGNN
jgi:hypothetical protein